MSPCPPRDDRTVKPKTPSEINRSKRAKSVVSAARKVRAAVKAGDDVSSPLPKVAKRKRSKSERQRLAEQAAQREHDRLRGLVVAATESEEVRERAFLILSMAHETVLQAVRNPACAAVVPIVARVDGERYGVSGSGIWIYWEFQGPPPASLHKAVLSKAGSKLCLQFVLFPGIADHLAMDVSFSMDFALRDLSTTALPFSLVKDLIDPLRERCLQLGMQETTSSQKAPSPPPFLGKP